MPQGTEPYNLSTIIEDHRAALGCAALLWGDEDITRGGVVVRLFGHLDGRRTKVGARAEVPHAFFRRG